MNTSEYLTGARPLVGTMAACGLMLLACSWFVLGPADLGRSRDVGTPAPVHIGGAFHSTVPTSHPGRRSSLRSVQDASARRNVAAKATLAPAGREPSRKPSPAAAAIESPSTAPAAPSSAAAPTTPGAPATQPAPELPAVTPTPPPVSVPEAPAVPLPAVQVPDVSSTPTRLGLP